MRQIEARDLEVDMTIRHPYTQLPLVVTDLCFYEEQGYVEVFYDEHLFELVRMDEIITVVAIKP